MKAKLGNIPQMQRTTVQSMEDGTMFASTTGQVYVKLSVVHVLRLGKVAATDAFECLTEIQSISNFQQEYDILPKGTHIILTQS